ncbi:hypothetical protein ACHQM5_017884 [Ranunculus cassubicifolius]
MSDTTVSPFQHAQRGDVDYFQSLEMDVLENSRDDKGNSVLSLAAQYGQLSCCRVIYRRCPQLLYERNNQGITPLHHAAYNGRNDIIKFLLIKIEGGVVETVDEELLMMTNHSKETALHYAVQKEGLLESAKLLTEADRNKKLLRMITADKNTALHYAVGYHHLEIVELLVEADSDFEYSANTNGKTPLFMAFEQALSGDQKTADIRKLLIRKQPTQCQLPKGKNNWTLIHHATHKGDLSAVKEIIHFWPDCCQLVDKKGQNFLHLAVKFEQVNILKYILELRNIVDSVLNGKDNYGNTPLHLATTSANQSIALALLDDHRVSKMVENKQGKKPLDIINFDYDKRRAGVLGLLDLVDEKELKDRSDFDLLVGALISTVSFTAGITVPGGYISDGPNRGNAILYKKRTFEAFVVFNTIALALSLFAVFSHFCMKRLVNKKDIIYQLKAATFCSIGAIFAMMVAFIMGSFAVLSISLGLAITVCGICCCFFGFSFYSLWRMRSQKRRGSQV